MWNYEAEEAKAVLVIVHGAMEYHGRYEAFAEMWNHFGYHVVMGDLPAHGTTSRNRGHIDSFDEYIEEVKTWITEAKKYRLPIFLFGHSMGGLISIRVMEETKMDDIQGILLSSPCLGVLSVPAAPLRAIAKVLNVIAPKMQFQSHITVEMSTRNKEVRDAMENDSLFLRKVSVRWYSELIKSVEIAHEKIAEFPDVPLLLMQACEDKLVDKTRVREWFDRLKINDKTYKEWPKCYHELFNEYERDEIFTYTKAFTETHVNNIIETNE
ncbi:alpha/beta hydrolase [Bacillus sp. DX1.1]|uniref:alpha/beta hydrolase n=1 Tax=unclassified Bacillus (in: firmicutes) TaxID=185979 RepID=UPI00257106A1|nr:MULTISPECIES: alpha/beta hydrolase [unclassified Bacillus (in: firmicutes)]MDM5156927.1 alpha/beta hydrolase [Bacillus sp. DX1.1]WJE81169.1 alpha/beta hydrolase [Bacillus sp. DX3.1]